MDKVILGISGMTCGGCVRSVSKVLNGLDGVANSDVSLEDKRAVVEYDPAKLGVAEMKRAIEEAGYEVTA